MVVGANSDKGGNMNYIQKIEEIKTNLRDANYNLLADDILEQQLSAGTGGEVLMMVCSKLLGLKEKDSVAYSKVKIQTEELLNYANSLGMYPIAT